MLEIKQHKNIIVRVLYKKGDLVHACVIEELKMSFSHFCDKAHLELGGYVNKQNFRFWVEENLRIINENL